MPSAHATFSVMMIFDCKGYFCPSCASYNLLCNSVFVTLRLFDRTVKIGIHYSILELRGDIRTTESKCCTSLNNKNIS